MFDTEAFIREVKRRPGLYSSRHRGEPGSKNLLWEEIGRAMFAEWPSPHHTVERVEKIRELRKKWKSVRDNFLRDMKANGERKKPYCYHDQLSFLVPHIQARRGPGRPRRRCNRRVAVSRPQPNDDEQTDIPEQAVGGGGSGKKKSLPELEPIQSAGVRVKKDCNREFLLTLAPLMDNLGSEEVERLKQEVLWSVETVGQTDRERKLVGLVANCPLLWQRGVSAPETAVEEALWTKVSQDAGLTVTDAKKMWGDLTMDLMRHLELPEPRPKWKFEDEMGFFVPYLIQQRREESIPMKVEKDLNISVERIESLHESQTGEMEEADDSDTLPLALCQVECPDSPIDNTQVGGGQVGQQHNTLFEFFVNMARTTATFPPRLQAFVKSEVFRAVNSAEIELHTSLAQHPELELAQQGRGPLKWRTKSEPF